METKQGLVCDGCGQAASAEHMRRRLQRLEWATRYRPVHIGVLLLGAVVPAADTEFFYSPADAFAGEAARLAEVAALTELDRPKEQLHTAFQRAGFFATHVLECPVESESAVAAADLLAQRLPGALTRIRRSLRPKRAALVSGMLEPFAEQIRTALPDCRIVWNAGRSFHLADGGSGEAQRLRKALAGEGFMDG